jgi:hypothetical protein
MLQDGFHDPAAFAAATQQGHSLRRLQQQLAAANGSSSGGKRPPVDETADKLDSLMEMTFTHLQWRVDAGGSGCVVAVCPVLPGRVLPEAAGIIF